MDGGLDDPLVRMHRWDALRQRLANSTAGRLDPVVDEVVEAVAAVLQRNGPLTVTVTVDGVVARVSALDFADQADRPARGGRQVSELRNWRLASNGHDGAAPGSAVAVLVVPAGRGPTDRGHIGVRFLSGVTTGVPEPVHW